MATEKSVMLVIRASRPVFRNNHDKVAFAVHASFLAAGHVLTAVGAPAFSDSALSSSSNDEVGIDGWNEVDGEFAFVYTNPEKGFKKTLVKCLVMNEKLHIDALADGNSEPVHTEINVDDYVGDGEIGDGNYTKQFKDLDKLVTRIDQQILTKLGESSKPGSSSSSNLQSSETSRGSTTHITEPNPDTSSAQIYPPGPGVILPPVNPYGGSDLFPGAGAGIYPQRGDFGGGSMLVGPNDPRWFGSGRGAGFPGLPQGVPPGARFDPFGPPGVPGFEPNRFGRGRGRGPGNGTHPDLEHFGGGSDFI